MAEVVRMPKLSDTMTEGVVAQWYKKVGDKVKSGEHFVDIETDKATMEYESDYTGTILHLGVDKGKAVPVNALLCIIGKEGEDIKPLLEAEGSAAAPAKEEKKQSAPEPKKEEKTEPVKKEQPVVAETPKTETKRVVAHTSVSSGTVSNGRIIASPLAKKIAQEKGLNLSKVKGTGEAGRIVKRDIDNFSGGMPVMSQVESYTEVNVSQMRKTIARRLAESKFSAPHFYLTIDIDMDRAIDARKSINESFQTKVSFNDFVIKGVALALKQHPKVNSSWLGDVIRMNDHVHIGVAVAVDEGLLVPVVRYADTKTLSQISGEVKEYAQKAKDKKLQPQDWEGNTFTISNLGMFGIEEFTAIINPPDACIMAIGGIRSVPVVKNGAVVPGNMMKVTLSCDHRVVDGATGAQFLQTFKTYMENPVVMLGQFSI